jgi:hypothetical protein
MKFIINPDAKEGPIYGLYLGADTLVVSRGEVTLICQYSTDNHQFEYRVDAPTRQEKLPRGPDTFALHCLHCESIELRKQMVKKLDPKKK